LAIEIIKAPEPFQTPTAEGVKEVDGVTPNDEQEEAVEECKKTISDCHTALLSTFSSEFQG
jgi:hypothetical protein